MAAACPLQADDLLKTLEASLHSKKSEWLFLRELRVGTGLRSSSAQRLDAFALNCLPHLGMKRICYEVKTSRADFLGELKHPLKRRIGMRYSNEFYFVTPLGMLRTSEIPVEAGLVEIGDAATRISESLVSTARFFHREEISGNVCIVSVPAPWRDTPGPTWQFAAAMLRNQRREWEERAAGPAPQQRLEF